MDDLIFIPLLTIITICAGTTGVALMMSMGFNLARRKGYNPAEAALLTISLWGIGALGAATFETHRLSNGAGSEFDPFILFGTVFPTVTLHSNAGMTLVCLQSFSGILLHYHCNQMPDCCT